MKIQLLGPKLYVHGFMCVLKGLKSWKGRDWEWREKAEGVGRKGREKGDGVKQEVRLGRGLAGRVKQNYRGDKKGRR